MSDGGGKGKGAKLKGGCLPERGGDKKRSKKPAEHCSLYKGELTKKI